MKIKRYIEFLNENKVYDTLFKVVDWLEYMEIENYTINDDLSVDVNGDVEVNGYNTTKEWCNMLVKFNNIAGNFSWESTLLNNLTNIPNNVAKNLMFTNNKLTTLKGCPEKVHGYFSCSQNLLTTLEGCPKNIEGDFSCSHNKLTTLVGGPEYVGDSMYCHTNKLTTMQGCPSFINNTIRCNGNPFTSLIGMPVDFDLRKLTLDDIYLKWNWLESIISENETNIKYHMEWIDAWKNSMPKTFEEKFGYLLEFEHYTKTLKQDEN